METEKVVVIIAKVAVETVVVVVGAVVEAVALVNISGNYCCYSCSSSCSSDIKYNNCKCTMTL